LWLWYRLAAVALIRLLSWELPYDMDTALKRQKEKKKLVYNRTPLYNRNKLTDFKTNLVVTIDETFGEREELGGWE